MNQKTITNQILEQKNFTLNSTLNYLFNISNMKKLFSYLLISSMVVLSSCTNYDDQFDDLNSQINSLKSQIEGFSSLSSGLTALQGTVSSLQSAVAALPKTATPATDISGLEASVAALQASLASASTSAEVSAISTELAAAQTALAAAIAANGTASDTNATNITALQTSLEAVQATLAELKTQLASASTTAEVAALTTSLAAVQADLTELLSQNNVYTPDANGLVINSASTLAFAETLGSKISIINGKVDIDQASTDIDAARLQAVVSKIKTVTGAVEYNQSGTGVTAVNFDNLTSAASVDVDQEAPFSMAKLVSSGAIVVATGNKVTSVSLPLLASVTSLSDGTVGDFDFPQATSINLASLVRYTPGDLSLTTKNDGTVNLTALTTTDVDGDQASLTLAISGPKSVTLSTFETGALTLTNVEVATLPKLTSAPTLTAAKLKELHMHNLQGALTLTSFSQLETLDIIGTYVTTGLAATVALPRSNNVSVTDASSLETLTLAGALGTFSVTGASNLTSVTTSGGMRSFSLTGATDLTELTLGHAPNASSTLKRSDLIVTGATNLTTITADKINFASTLTIEDNPALTKVSFAALEKLSTETDQLVASVTIDDNDLHVQSVQIPTGTGVTPAVAASITTDSGVKAMKKYLDAAIAKAGSTVYVFFDNVLEVVKANGDKVVGTDGTPTVPTAINATGNSSTISTVEDAGWIFIDIYGGIADTADLVVKQTQSVYIPVNYEGNSLIDVQTVATNDLVTIKAGGLTHTFDGGSGTGDYASVTDLASAIGNFDFGSDYTVTATRDAGKVAYVSFNYTNAAGVASTITNITASSYFILDLGGVTKTYQATGVASEFDGITSGRMGAIVANLFNDVVVSGVKYTAVQSGSTGTVKLTAQITPQQGGADADNLGFSGTYPSLSMVITDTANYVALSSNASNTSGISSDYFLSTNKYQRSGLRITMVNNSFTTAFVSSTETITVGAVGGALGTLTDIVSGTHTYGSSWTIPFSAAGTTEYSDGTPARKVDATDWL